MLKMNAAKLQKTDPITTNTIGGACFSIFQIFSIFSKRD